MIESIAAPQSVFQPYPVPAEYKTDRKHCSKIWEASRYAVADYWNAHTGYYAYTFRRAARLLDALRMVGELRLAGADYWVFFNRQGVLTVAFYLP